MDINEVKAAKIRLANLFIKYNIAFHVEHIFFLIKDICSNLQVISDFILIVKDKVCKNYIKYY